MTKSLQKMSECMQLVADLHDDSVSGVCHFITGKLIRDS